MKPARLHVDPALWKESEEAQRTSAPGAEEEGAERAEKAAEEEESADKGADASSPSS